MSVQAPSDTSGLGQLLHDQPEEDYNRVPITAAVVTVVRSLWASVQGDPVFIRRQPEIETVIERHPSYFLVEKRERDAQEVARDTDPRS